MKSQKSYRFPFSRYPAFRLLLPFLGGILFSKYLGPPAGITLLLFFAASLLWIAVEWAGTRQNNLRFFQLSIPLYLLLLFGSGILRHQSGQNNEPDIAVKLTQVSGWEDLTLSGIVRSTSRNAAGEQRWDYEVNRLILGDLTAAPARPFTARVLAGIEARPGDTVLFKGTIVPIAEKRNPHDFNYGDYLKSRGIHFQVKLTHLITLHPDNRLFSFYRWRNKALIKADKLFKPSVSPIAKALLLGHKTELDRDSRLAFSRAGLSHIMAVSGLHVGFVVAPLWLLFPFLWTRKYGKALGMILLLLLLFFYGALTGFSVSVVRASVMALFLSFGKLYHKPTNSLNLTAGAAFLLLIWDPGQLFEIGFQLSFSAVLIILLVLPVLQGVIPFEIRTRPAGKPLMVVLVSLVVQFGLYPLQAFYFGEVSIISPVANALFVPFLGVIIPFSLFLLGLSFFLPSISILLSFPVHFFLQQLLQFVHYISSWNWAWFVSNTPEPLFFIFWLFLLLFVSSLQIPEIRWKLFILTLMLGCSLQLHNLAGSIRPAELRLTFLDVGQADAALIQTPAGKNILIDTGRWSPDYDSGRGVILPGLKAMNIKRLHAVILSHPHADHIGGIKSILNNLPVDTLYNSGFPYESSLYHSYKALADSLAVPVRQIHLGRRLYLDPSLLILGLGPDGLIHNGDPNEHSVVLKIIYGNTSVLFTGDAGDEQEQRLSRQYRDLLRSQLLKAGHHGSKTSSTEPFLNQVQPEIVVVSHADRNKFGHPHPAALQRLSDSGARLLFTGRDKALVFHSDGRSWKRVHWQ